FPRSIKIGPASVAWLESEIDEWINLKLSSR
ncbi:AlpA family phage regulatory protein, partial [Citrobacter freundii]